jgi:hypothetical protein
MYGTGIYNSVLLLVCFRLSLVSNITRPIFGCLFNSPKPPNETSIYNIKFQKRLQQQRCRCWAQHHRRFVRHPRRPGCGDRQGALVVHFEVPWQGSRVHGDHAPGRNVSARRWGSVYVMEMTSQALWTWRARPSRMDRSNRAAGKWRHRFGINFALRDGDVTDGFQTNLKPINIRACRMTHCEEPRSAGRSIGTCEVVACSLAQYLHT